MPTASYEKFQPALELMLEGGNLERVIANYKELQQREEDDIEMLLIGAL